jgi:ATP-dependent Lhr-like helicase
MRELDPIFQFFENRGWTPFPFQVETWKAFLAGESGLVHVPTGSGKTYAGIMEPIAQILATPKKKGPRLLYLTPLRALARDLELALREPIEQEGWPIRVESRMGDTSFAAKKKQLKNPADILLTTPESLSVMISQPEGEEVLKNVECVVVDEWHELLSSKRGTMTDLCLAYLRFLNPRFRTRN